MSDAPTQTPAPEPGGGGAAVPPSGAGLPGRAFAPAVLPILAGVVVLGGALYFLFSTPRVSAPVVDGLQTRLGALDERLVGLERLPGRIDAGEGRLGAIEARAAELTARPAGDPALRPALDALGQRLGALDAREAEASRQAAQQIEERQAAAAQRAGALEARLAEGESRLRASTEAGGARLAETERRLETRLSESERATAQRVGEAERQLAQRLADAEAAIAPRLAALDRTIAERVDAATRQLDERVAAQNARLDERLTAFDARVRQAEGAERRVGFLAARGGIQSALEAGRPLGAALAGLPGTPPEALRRYATAAPPTEAALRLGFEDAARLARGAAEPQGQGVVDSALSRLQGLVTVRRGDQVVVGDAVSGELEQARRSLDAGDLAGAVERLDRVAPQPRAAMQPWLDEARGLLAAREALRLLAAPAAPEPAPGRGRDAPPAGGATAGGAG